MLCVNGNRNARDSAASGSDGNKIMCTTVDYQGAEIATLDELKALIGTSRIVFYRDARNHRNGLCLCGVNLIASADAAGLTTVWTEHCMTIDFQGGPLGIRRQRTKGYKLPANTVCVSRPGQWGNPFKVGDVNAEGVVMDAAMCIAAHEAWLPASGLDLEALRGKNLACWCALDAPCHRNVLLRMANQ